MGGPKFFIPYFSGDDGDRKKGFPNGILSYWCAGLKIRWPDGTLYTGGELPRNQTSTVTVEVANGGTNPEWAKVELYWTDPSSGFGPPHLKRPPELGSPTKVYVNPGTTETSEPITFRPRFPLFATPGHEGTPDHVCLIAVVSHVTSDPHPASWDPLTDRHYAQHNLDVRHVDAGGVSAFQFFVANPFAEAARIIVRLRPASGEETRALSAVYASEPGDLPADALRLMAAVGEGAQRPARELRLELRGGERHLCQGLVSAAGLRPGQFVAAEVETSAAPRGGEHGLERKGSYGVVVFVGR
jgi:hypothetical protein